MSVAGIDVSTKAIAVVVLDDEGNDASGVTLHLDGHPWEVARQLPEAMMDDEWWHGVYLVGIEDPMGPYAGSLKKMGIIIGALLTCIPTSLTVLPLPPEEWKRETCGAPRAKKPDVAKWVAETWPAIPNVVSQDTLDAYAIAWAARAVNGRAVTASETIPA